MRPDKIKVKGDPNYGFGCVIGEFPMDVVAEYISLDLYRDVTDKYDKQYQVILEQAKRIRELEERNSHIEEKLTELSAQSDQFAGVLDMLTSNRGPVTDE